MSKTPESRAPDPFGNIPYLALPTICLVILTIGVAFAAKQHSQSGSTPTAITDTVVAGCQILEQAVDFIILKCRIGTFGPH